MPGAENVRCKKCDNIVAIERIVNDPTCPACGHHEFETVEPTTPVCDFCSTPNVSWMYPCKDFKAPVVPGLLKWASSSYWAACNQCHKAIQAGRRDDLAYRSAKRAKRKGGTSLSMLELKTHIRGLHDKFWANREGEPIEIGAVNK